MKIAYVTGSYPDMPCGVGDHVARLAEAVARAGHEVRVVTSRSAEVRATPVVRPVIESWGRGCDRAAAEAAGDAEIVHFHAPTIGYGRSIWARRIPVSRALRMPVVSTVHEYSALHPLHRWATRPVLRGSRALIVPGEEDAERLRARGFRVVQIPVGPNILPPAEPPPRTGKETVFFGMVYRGKGIEVLCRAAAELDGAPLVAMGQPHPGYAAMVEEARRACGDRVAWTGRLEAAEVSHRLSTCALCVLPYEEGASLRRTTLLTALAHGAPVVTTRPRRPIDGLEEAALLIDRAEGGLLAAAIRRALGDEALRARLSAGALRLAGRFSWGAVAERTLEVYRSCLNP